MIPDRLVDLTTARCVLRPVTTDDVDALHALFTSAGVRRFLWDDEVIPIERTRGVVELSQRLFAERGFGLWGAWPPDSSHLIGFGAFWPFRDPPEFELLYGVAEPQWGTGYAPEIAQAVLTYCFDTLGLRAVRASTDAGNVASVRVLEKLGFAFAERKTVGGLDTVFYELERRTSPARSAAEYPRDQQNREHQNNQQD
jgi:[ribosomal protein S5]-alanine N-acetyltransferase